MGFGKKVRHAFKHHHHFNPVSIVQSVVRETGKAAEAVVSVTTKAASDVVKEAGHGAEHGFKEVVKGGKMMVNAPKKVIHSVVKHKVNPAFEKKMLEAIDNIEKELGERKAQDKAIIDQAIAEKIKETAETYKNLTDTKALQEAELELMEMLRTITSAIHDCRYGFRDSVEDILKLDFDDYRVVEFLNKRPLSLTLQNFATHQNSEALSILLPYFDKNIAQLSAENKADYSFLKEYLGNKLGTQAEKEETETYFAKMVQLIATDAKACVLKVSNNSITAEVKNVSTTGAILAQLNHNGVGSVNTTPDIKGTANPVPIMSAPTLAVSLSSENHVVPEEINGNVCRM